MSELNNLLINEYVIVRTYSAGVFFGKLIKKEDNQVELHNARRLWKWVGAASLSQLAEEGVTQPEECKFPIAVKQIILLGVIEIIKVSAAAKNSIDSVPIWSA